MIHVNKILKISSLLTQKPFRKYNRPSDGLFSKRTQRKEESARCDLAARSHDKNSSPKLVSIICPVYFSSLCLMSNVFLQDKETNENLSTMNVEKQNHS